MPDEWLKAIQAATLDDAERKAMIAANNEMLGEVWFAGETSMWEDPEDTADFLLRVVRCVRAAASASCP
jgi:hypothetical protein